MTTRPRKPTTARPVTGKKVAGRKQKPVTLDRVTYQFGPTSVTYLGPLTQLNPIKEEYEMRTRFTVRVRHMLDSIGKCWVYAVWDKQRKDWLYPVSNHDQFFTTRAAARCYLKTTTVEDREFKLEMANQALDRGAA